MSINEAVNVLRKYEIDVDLRAERVTDSAMEIYSEISRWRISLSEQEHITLFDAIWELGNISRGKNMPISPNIIRRTDIKAKVLKGYSNRTVLIIKY